MALNQITTIFFDVDGIFTDGSLYFSDNGVNITKFNVHDGMGCILLKEAGIELLILTARHSDAVIKRFKDLGIDKIFTKVLKKRDFIKEYSKAHNLAKKELAMMGDDLQDLAAIDEVGVFFTTPNAIDIVKDSADFITKRSGGDGAVREICDLIIRSKGSSSSLEFERYIEKR
jgi:3-deoxy-D-manno-octulosonate 8-phosphate phosphatase (KDO 8-P phosphatase)